MQDHLQSDGPTLASYLDVIRRRKFIILACAILAPLVAVLASRQAPQYEASADVYINKQNLASALTGIQDTQGDEERAAGTQASLASVPEVARRAILLAKVDDRTAADLLAQSSVTPKGLTDILEFSVADGEPVVARQLASAYAGAFVEYRERLDTQSIARARKEVVSALDALERQGRRGETLYANLEEKQQQLQTLQTLQTSRAYVVRRADDATQVSPHPVRNGVLGVALGIVLGLGLAFLFEALDTRIRTAVEVAGRLGLPLLARIPAPRKKLQRADNLVMVAEPSSVSAEAFRMLRTNLEFAMLDSDVRVLLVTSAVEAEGKSTTAANLAVALARAGRRVVLADLDLRRAYAHRFFRLFREPGITNVALGGVSLDEALVTIDLATGLPKGGHAVEHGEFLNGNGNGNGHQAHGELLVLPSRSAPTPTG